MLLYFILVIYILLLGLYLSSGKESDLKQRIYLYLTFGLLTVLAALRAETVGNDTIEYLRLFENISITKDLSYFSPRFEIGYVYLNKILSLISYNPQIILIVTSSLIMYGFMRFIKKYSKIPMLSVFMFFSLGYYGMTMNTIRLNLAIVLILFSYDFLKKNKLFKFIIIVILASLFHRTAIVFLIAWPMRKLSISLKLIMAIMITSSLLYILFPTILNLLFSIFPTYQYYVGSVYLDGEIRLASIMNILVGLSIILLGAITKYNNMNLVTDEIIKEKDSRRKSEEEIVNDEQLMFLFLIISVAITFLSFKFNLLDRVSDYFLVFSIVYLPNAIKHVKEKKLVVFLVLVIITLFFIYATLIQIMRPEWNRIYPYEFFWNM
ncbi:EpsG family protein [Paenibacillus sp. FSL R7-0163]|uniref:EpsG family protein n=1 Tax=Paenibacillus sp. FSL R7-0163 TaxID=2954530 RepID=UPI0030DBBBDC